MQPDWKKIPESEKFSPCGAARWRRKQTGDGSYGRLTRYYERNCRKVGSHAWDLRLYCGINALPTARGSSSAVERKLPKLDVAGSIPVSRSILLWFRFLYVYRIQDYFFTRSTVFPFHGEPAWGRNGHFFPIAGMDAGCFSKAILMEGEFGHPGARGEWTRKRDAKETGLPFHPSKS